ncbi:MAG TPA: hypothetical protein VF998_00665 [Candidatus Limnocylindria bacterium]
MTARESTNTRRAAAVIGAIALGALFASGMHPVAAQDGVAAVIVRDADRDADRDPLGVDATSEPRVCRFDVIGSGFAAGESGGWSVEEWSPAITPGGTPVLDGRWGPGPDWGIGPVALTAGHYSLFVERWIPDAAPARIRVTFWVDCPPQAVLGFESGPAGPTGRVTPGVETPASPTSASGALTWPWSATTVSTLPASGSAPPIPLAGLGIALMAAGGLLLRRSGPER